jgi:hypothetical protein
MAVNEGSIKEFEGVCNGGMALVKYPAQGKQAAISPANLATGSFYATSGSQVKPHA